MKARSILSKPPPKGRQAGDERKHSSAKSEKARERASETAASQANEERSGLSNLAYARNPLTIQSLGGSINSIS